MLKGEAMQTEFRSFEQLYADLAAIHALPCGDDKDDPRMFQDGQPPALIIYDLPGALLMLEVPPGGLAGDHRAASPWSDS